MMRLLPLFVCVLLFAACQSEPPVQADPPEGWQADGTRWWRTGVDTSTAFRPLETLGDMGVEAADAAIIVTDRRSISQTMLREQLEARVKGRLIELYRNEPAVVDSLFEKYVAPMVRRAENITDANFNEQRDEIRDRGYRLLLRYFRPAQTLTTLGQDVEVIFPDSLVQNGVSGTVRVQLYLDAEGVPQSVHLIEGVHPQLDRILLNAATRMRYLPAYLNGDPIRSWTRLNMPFNRAAASQGG